MRPRRNAADHSLYVTPCFKMAVLLLCERSKLYGPPMHDTRKHSRIVGGFRHIFKELSAPRALPGFLLAPERSHLWRTKKTRSDNRTEERRVGNECVNTCRSRVSPNK